MRKVLFLLFFTVPMVVSGQVANSARILPERSFSLGITPAYHVDRNVILFDAGGPAFGLSAGYGVKYPLDVNARYIYFMNGTDYIGIDMQYLLHEARHSYFSVNAGLHKWDEFGFDLTGLFTYSPRFNYSFSVGLDLDLSFAEVVNPRFWLPVNAGVNLNEMIYLFLEYSLPVSERSWDIFALGAHFVFRQ
jgi:hypothetical protein